MLENYLQKFICCIRTGIILLNEIEVRVLGSLMEKALSTPDYYPLSLNALTNACNQKSSRDPVSSYDESTVEAAAAGLDQKGLLNRSNVGRVPKYEERFSQKYNFVPRETAAKNGSNLLLALCFSK